jgi:hypothetical protein
MRWQDKQMYGEKKMTHQNEALSFEQFHSSHTLAEKKDEDRLLLLRIKSVSLAPSNFALIKNARTHGRCAKTERCIRVIYFLLGVYCWLGTRTRLGSAGDGFTAQIFCKTRPLRGL